MLRGIQLWGRRHQETPHLSDRPNKTQQSPVSRSLGLGVSVKAQLLTSVQALVPAPRILPCSVQALTPAPGELTSTTPPHRSSLARSTQAAGHQDQGESRRGFGRIRHRCALQAILPLRRLLLTSARSARVLTPGDCRTERPMVLRREPSCSPSPGQLPARSLRELAPS
jgi:hypothetical protein